MKKYIFTAGGKKKAPSSFASETWRDPSTGITWSYKVNGASVSLGGVNEYGWDIGAVPKSTRGAIVIPSKMAGKSVTSIGSSAFYDCSALESVVIPSSVTSIGRRAFNSCSGLTSISIPASVTSIAGGAFNGCSGLRSFSVDASNPNYKSKNGLLLSKDGTELIAGVNGDVTIPAGVTSIGDSAFAHLSGLKSVRIPPSVTSIGDVVFFGCGGLRSFSVDASNPDYKSKNGLLLSKDGTKLISGVNGDVTIPLGVTSIEVGAFWGSGLTSVVIPSSVTSIRDWAFSDCSGLRSFSVDASNPKYKSKNGLLLSKDGTKLISGVNGDVTIPLGVTSIEAEAFYGCIGLTSVVIPPSVTSVGLNAFGGFFEMRTVTVFVCRGDASRIEQLLDCDTSYDYYVAFDIEEKDMSSMFRG